MYKESDFLEAKLLITQLIACPSLSKEEAGTAKIIHDFFENKGIKSEQFLNNIWAKNAHFDPSKPSVLLNSHHDTVKANASWTFDPWTATEIDGKLIGLGSNDAGASLVCLIQTFCSFYEQENLPFNLVLAATAEEEISGKNGIEALLQSPDFPKIDWAIVGEPTDCQMATAEKGLMVIDAVAHGKAGHAARNEGINAIYVAMKDIQKIENFQFEKVSPVLGPVKTTVTIINAGKQHNVIPDTCEFSIDCRVNECYTLEEVLDILKQELSSDLIPRSIRLQPSRIDENHVICLAAKALGISTFGSPTLSDQSLLTCPSVKIGPGHSGRSHTADEFIYLDEIKQGIQTYQQLLTQSIIQYQHKS
ncbi:M20 family metallo-hydrolase [Aquirufa nivalisilvae]|uniref:M20 family metallo-hydrolase n=1 Tax=Aquirufa nivalisilvae TaxID=2516557 RepID=UPI0022A9BD49|nr:M20 family metallo-hydrolase [Aquirufa nivalisilvae]MCZ2480485.1 M20 family metallo-hydrolase [Aquirufa nivalisilvae]MCZ2482720.1 M20 family metallo-hydrolase [Aquirufa nivalisilvae]